MLVRDAVSDAQQELAVETGEHNGKPVDHALLLTPDEAARRLSVGRTTIYGLMASGELSSVTIGRCRRVAVSSLQSFVARLVDNAFVDGSQW